MSARIQLAEVKFTKGSYIILEGRPNADKFYIIKKGEVQITRESDELISESNKAGTGEMFGVISVMASRSYIETVYALTDVTALAVDRRQISKNSILAMNIVKQCSRKLRELNEVYSRSVMKGAASEDSSCLIHIAAFYEKFGRRSQALYAYQQYLEYYPDTVNTEKVKLKIEKLKANSPVVRPVYTADTMIQKWPKGCLLFAEGEKGNNLYIIQEGAVKITKVTDNQEIVLEILTKGAVLGEMAMIEDKLRGATAEIHEDSVLLSVNRKNFKNLITDQPDMVIRLITTMAERIWLRYRQITNTLIKNFVGRVYDAMLIQIEKDHVDMTLTNIHIYNFNFKELAGMAGVPEDKTTEIYNKLSSARRITENNGKLCVLNIASIVKEADYYRRAQYMSKDINNRIDHLKNTL